MTTHRHTYNLPFTVTSKNEVEGVTALEIWAALHRAIEEISPPRAGYNDIHDICGFPINTTSEKP